MPSTLPTRSVRSRLEQGFTLIEVIVAVVILSVVVTGFAVAVTSGEKAGQHERVAANKAAIAKKAHEQLQGNVDAQTACGKIWVDQEQAKINSASAVAYQTCTWPTSGAWILTDDEGRSYRITASLKPVDEPADGTGLARSVDNAAGAQGDADFNTRDRIDVTIGVTLDPGSTAGLTPAEATDTYTLEGRMGWSNTETRGSARISVCALDRPDRAMANGRCVAGAATEDQPAQPMNGVVVKLTPLGGGTTFTASSSNGIASFNGVLPDGTYQISATAPGGYVLFKVSPKAITVDGSDVQDATVYLARTGSQFEVCGRITNADNYGFGWKVTQATLNWGALGAPLRKGLRLAPMSDTWKCVATGLVDPLGYSSSRLYRGRYVLEVSEVGGETSDLRVSKIGACSTGNAADWGLFSGSITDPAPLVTPAYRRGLDFRERDGAKNARMCIEFYSTPIEALDCVKGSAGCKLIDKQCSPASCKPEVDCWNCGTVPVLPNGSYPTIGPAGVHNGPNEGNVSCRNRQTATVWGNPFYAGWSESPRSVWNGRNFLGVKNPYLSVQGRHPDGRWNECQEIAFTMARSYTNTCGGFSIGHPCKGSKPYSLGDCIEAKLGGRVVRGPLYDTFIAGQPSLGLEIGAWDRIIDHPSVDHNWWAGGASVHAPRTYGSASGVSPSWLNGWPNIRWRKVKNDSWCQSSSEPVDKEDKIQDVVPAVIVEVYKKPGPDDVGDPAWPIPGVTQVAPVTSTKSL